MKDSRERMQWFLRFTELDFSQFRAGDWLNLREDIWLLVRGLPLYREGQKIVLTEAEERQLTPENLTTLQPYVKNLLKEWARFNELVGNKSKDWKWFATGVKGRILTVSFSATPDGSKWISVEAEHLEDVFLFTLGSAWCGLSETELRKCPSCERLFLIDHGRQKFCSFKCKNTEAQRRFREAHKEQESMRGRRSYEKKIKKKLGPNVQVKKRTSALQSRKER